MLRRSGQRGFAVQSLEQRRLLAVTGPHFLDFTLELPSGRSSDRVIQADVNGDGMLDLVSFSTTSFGIFSFAGYGNGTFGPATVILDLASVDDIVPADFNEDGRDDLLVLGATFGDADLLLSTPSGTYLKSRLITGDHDLRIGVADLDSDGHADIVSTSSVSGPASAVLLRGNGDGTFQPAAELSPDLSYAGFIGAADLDDDGNLDLLLRTRLGATTVDPFGFAFLRGLGDGTFESHLFSAPAQGSLLVDATGDGTLDIVGSDNTTLTVRPGMGDGSFGAALSSPAQFGTVSVTDFDRDGVPDVVVVRSGSAYLQRGRGDGTFESPVALLYGSGTSSDMLVADLDRDGTADLVSPEIGSPNKLGLYFGDGAGGLLPVELPFYSGTFTTVFVEDLNGDGRDDLVTYNTTSSVIRVQLQQADGSFSSLTTYSPGSLVSSFNSIAKGDIDADGDTDFIIAVRLQSYLFRNNGDGTFVRSIIEGPSGAVSRSLAADFNADGADDLLIVASGAYLSLSNGDGTFAPLQSLGFNAGPIVASDFDFDGSVDLATMSTTTSIQIHLGNGDGSFHTGQTIAVAAVTSSESALAAGHFNGDPFVDLVLTRGSRIDFIGGKAKGLFEFPKTTTLNSALSRFSTADIDNDGILELVTMNDHPLVFDVRDDGTVASATPLVISQTANSSAPRAILDVNGDGKQDVLIVSLGAAESYAFLNVGRTVAPSLLDARYDVDSRQVSFRFDAALLAGSVELADLDMTASASGARVNPTSVSLSADGRTAIFTLPAALVDGEYHIAIRAGAVTSVDGLQNNFDATMPSQRSFILAGDLNRDRTVNFDDLLTLAQNYGQTGRTFSQGNIDYSADGLVGFEDLLMLAQRYGTSLVASEPAITKPSSKRRVSVSIFD